MPRRMSSSRTAGRDRLARLPLEVTNDEGRHRQEPLEVWRLPRALTDDVKRLAPQQAESLATVGPEGTRRRRRGETPNYPQKGDVTCARWRAPCEPRGSASGGRAGDDRDGSELQSGGTSSIAVSSPAGAGPSRGHAGAHTSGLTLPLQRPGVVGPSGTAGGYLGGNTVGLLATDGAAVSRPPDPPMLAPRSRRGCRLTRTRPPRRATPGRSCV